MDRRAFLTSAAAASAGAVLTRVDAAASTTPARHVRRAQQRALRILILGGTGFIGPHQVQAAKERGHTLTLFNRGQTNPGLFPDIETLHGDRNGDLRELEGRRWDCVIDNSGFEPDQLTLSATVLRDAIAQYLFVSTQSVYSDRSILDQDESGAIGRAGVPEQEWSGYGPLKARSEIELMKILSDRTTIVRPAVIVGPGDASDRFTYWVQRIHRGGEVLAPGNPEDPTQLIDVRDLAEWMIRLLEQRTFGKFNATGPLAPLSIAEMLYGIRAITSSPVSFTWADATFLQQQGVRPFSDMPMWMVPAGATAGFMRMSARRAQGAGLTYRPLATTAAQTLEWWLAEPAERRDGRLRAGLPADREAEVLAAWHTAQAR